MEMKDKLKKLRKDRGLAQAQLAEALFVSRSTVAKWEMDSDFPVRNPCSFLSSFTAFPVRRYPQQSRKQ